MRESVALWVSLTTVAVQLAACGTTMPRGAVRELRVAEDALIVTYAGEIPSCRDHALYHAARAATARGYHFLTVSTPPTMLSTDCEVHVRMFRERPESPHVVVYDVEITLRSLREELAL